MGPATELLQALVRAASPNPPGDERAVMAVARRYLADIPGMVVQDVGVAPARPMLVASLEGHRAGRTLTFAGHVDTVPVGAGWTHDPFAAELSDGRLYGRGASDMKGGVAGFLVALRQLADLRDRWAGSLIAHVVPDEEPGGQNGTATLLARGLIGGDAVVVAEPSELCAFLAQKGNLFARLQFSGRSAHGSTPELGQNAILMAARTAIQLEEVLAPVLARRRHELVGSATVSVGTIAGGRRTNMVADECVLTIDRRLIPGEDPTEAAAELEHLVGGAATITYEHIGAAFETSADHWLARDATAIINIVRGETCPVGGLVGSSDARYYAAGGVPTIIIGPGAMSEAHAPNESVDLRLLELSVEVYRELALRVLAPDAS